VAEWPILSLANYSQIGPMAMLNARTPLIMDSYSSECAWRLHPFLVFLGKFAFS
jgi:hypothetical protein